MLHKHLILIILASFSHFMLKGQKTSYYLTGQMKVRNGDSFPYKLSFTLKNNQLLGISETRLKNGQSPKTPIKGHFDEKSQSISFAEYDADNTNSITCFLSATLHLTQTGKSACFQGNFKGLDHYGKYCGEGSIKLNVSPSFYADLVKPSAIISRRLADSLGSSTRSIPTGIRKELYTTKLPRQTNHTENLSLSNSKDHTPGQKTAKQDDLLGKLRTSISTPDEYSEDREYEITSGVTQQFVWRSDTCLLDIYDGGVIDGDMVTVTYNGEEILQKYTLTKHKHRLKLVLKNKTNNILIIAENLGKAPPNTANIVLTDGKRQYKIKAFNDIGESAEITLKKTP